MASRTYTSNNNTHRVIVNTILTHLVVFHEAGFEVIREKKRTVPVQWWNPSTWSGYVWERSNEPAEPTNFRGVFIQGRDIERDGFFFNASVTRQTGYCKVIFVFAGSGPSDLGNDARSVNDVKLTYRMNGNNITLRHTSG